MGAEPRDETITLRAWMLGVEAQRSAEEADSEQPAPCPSCCGTGVSTGTNGEVERCECGAAMKEAGNG